MAERHGTKLADIIAGRAMEQNTLWGYSGDDALTGAELDDLIFGGKGNDNASGGASNDVVFGNTGDDLLRGTEGDDILNAGEGNDYLSGGKGGDVLFAGKGDDYLDGNSGNDALLGDSGNDTLLGNQGRDWLYGGAGDDKIYAGTGDDSVLVSSGHDSYWGGEGWDEIDFSAITGKVTVDLSRHSATIAFGKTTVTDIVSGFEVVQGSHAGSRLLGNSSENKFYGGDGADYIRGMGGNDTMNGGEGRDIYAFLKKDTAGGAVDLIRDFEAGADKLDVSDFMKGRSTIADAIRLTAGGEDTIVQGHTKTGWVDVVVLAGVDAHDVGYDILT